MRFTKTRTVHAFHFNSIQCKCNNNDVASPVYCLMMLWTVGVTGGDVVRTPSIARRH